MAEMQHRPEKNSIDICDTGTDDRNESVEENLTISGPGQMQVVWGIQRDNPTFIGKMQTAGRIGVSK